jgi:hypothetical protein
LDAAVSPLPLRLSLHGVGRVAPAPSVGGSAPDNRRHGEGPARKAWESEWSFPKEDVEPEHQLAFGGVLSFDELLRLPLRDGEDFEPDEPTRFGRLSKRLWGGVRSCEELAEG